MISMNYIHQTHSKLKYANKYDCSIHEASCIMFQPPLLLLANIVHNSDSFLNTSRKLREHKKKPSSIFYIFIPTHVALSIFLSAPDSTLSTRVETWTIEKKNSPWYKFNTHTQKSVDWPRKNKQHQHRFSTSSPALHCTINAKYNK